MILLTNAEMWGLTVDIRDESLSSARELVEDTAKAQAKKIVEFIKSEEERAFTDIGEAVHIIQIPESSWQALLKEIE